MENRVICCLCGVMNHSLVQHLKIQHNLTTKQYFETYNQPIYSAECHKNLSEAARKRGGWSGFNKIFKEKNPDKYREYQELRRINCRYIGQKFGHIGGSIGGKNNWLKNRVRMMEHVKNNGKISGRIFVDKYGGWASMNRFFRERFPEKYHTHHKMLGQQNVATGRLFKAMNGTLIKHDNHIHRSKDELRFCDWLHSLYPNRNILVNKIIGYGYNKAEIDFIIVKDNFWERCIEWHHAKTWRGETHESYCQERYSKLRKLGVLCPIEIFTQKNFDIYNMRCKNGLQTANLQGKAGLQGARKPDVAGAEAEAL